MIAAALLACAANVAPATLEAVIAVESRGDPMAIYVNGLASQPRRPANIAEAAWIANAYINAGYRVDLGLMQVDSRNLPAFGYTVAQVLDSCTNIRAGGTILTADYAAAARTLGPGQRALRAALSAYNTGDFERGFANGYVARYYGQAGKVITAGATPRTVGAERETSAPPNPYAADMVVYVREAMNIEIR